MKDWAYMRILIMLVISILLLVVSIIAAYLPQQPDLSSHVLTKPKVLFSLQYGEEDSQVGMFIPHPAAEDAGEPMGPSDFAVGADGCIYIGDEQNGKVKKFSRDGRLLMMTEGRIDRISGMTVDRQGKIYVIHGALSNEIAVYDPKGKRMPEIEKKIKGAIEGLKKKLMTIQPNLENLVFGGLKCDSIGNLYLIGQSIIKIDTEFERAQVVKGYPYIANLLYSYQLLPPERRIKSLVYDVKGSLVNYFLANALQRAEVTIYKFDGSIVRKLIIPKGEWSELEKSVPIGVSDIICDERGHFYTLMSPIAVYHLPLRSDNPRFFIVSYYVVLEYDEEGKFEGIRAIINGSPMPSAHWLEVDMHGNVYWLEFKSNHVDVMIAPTP
jgi:hypothetical protein